MITLQAGIVISGRYSLEKQLGAGGMGVVWSARDLATGVRFALKLLLPEEDDTENSRRRFMREARAAASVRHPHVVTVHDVLLLEDGTPVIVMELLEGEPLSARLKREKKLSIESVARLLLPVVSAVGAAHTLGIVHRDLKPDNIFLAKSGAGDVVKVVDFGIAKLTLTGDGEKTGGLTTTGTILGTPYYMSPEQAFGEKDIDYRSDIWSLGIVIYKCLTGIVPTKAENAGQTLKIILSDKIPLLSEAAPGTPEDIVRLVRKMLTVDRHARPTDLREVRAALAAYAPDVTVPDFGDAVIPPPRSSSKLLMESDVTEKETRRASFERTKKLGASHPMSEASLGASARSIGGPPPLPTSSPWRTRLAIIGGGLVFTAAASAVTVHFTRPAVAKVKTTEPMIAAAATALPPPRATETVTPQVVDAGAPVQPTAAPPTATVAPKRPLQAVAKPVSTPAPVTTAAPDPNAGKFVEKPPF